MAAMTKDVNTKMAAPTPGESLSAAVMVSVLGVGNVGVKTKLQVMWPYYELDDALVAKEAAQLLIDAHTAALKALPPQYLEQIWKDRDERLFSVCAP